MTTSGTGRRATDPGWRFAWSEHLVTLVAQAEAASARLLSVPAEVRRPASAAAARRAARLSARLDASPLTEATADRVDARLAVGLPPTDAAPTGEPLDSSGGWAAALGLDRMPTQEVAAVEYANLLACSDREPELAEDVFERPLEVLAALHAEICRGLVDVDLLGRPRRTAQAVHDGAQGKVVYHAADAQTVPALLEQLAQWMTTTSARLPATVVAGVVHGRLLEWHPYEAGNGRLARALARVVLRARGLDPDGFGGGEEYLIRDLPGYYAEVAATKRRRGDLTLWLERVTEATAAALTAAADDLAPRQWPASSGRARQALASLDDGAALTLSEYIGLTGATRATARVDLDALVADGCVAPQPRSRGLRFVVIRPASPSAPYRAATSGSD